jgi:metallo-beta-lactamase family protein
VKAEVKNLEGLSAHTDQKGLIDWMSGLKQNPKHIFIVHGEHNASVGLKDKIKEVYGWNSTIPKLNQISIIEDKELV